MSGQTWTERELKRSEFINRELRSEIRELRAKLAAIESEQVDANPCAIISKDDGRDYGRFFLTPISNCGKFETMKMLNFWSNPQEIPTKTHPFAWLLKFISSRPQGCSTPADWLDHAHDHLTALGELPAGFPRSVDLIPDLVARFPESRASYVLAFVHCRALCLHFVQAARRQVMMSSRDGRAHQVIDARLPSHVRRNLIARLDG